MSAEPADQEDTKPKLTLTVSHGDQKITVKVKAAMKLQKIIQAAEKKFGKEPGTLRFTYDGKRVQPEDTPADLEMEDGDMIDAHLEQNDRSAAASATNAKEKDKEEVEEGRGDDRSVVDSFSQRPMELIALRVKYGKYLLMRNQRWTSVMVQYKVTGTF